MAPAPKISPEQQEKLIIIAAVTAIEETSVLDFSMSSIAKQAGISMGSVYKFVQSKEDVLIALATRMYQERQKIFKQALSLPLTTPERIIAISLLDHSKVRMYSFDDQLENIVNTRAIMKRCSRRWLDQMITCSQTCSAIFQNTLESAVNSGELTSGSRDIEEITLSTWSLAVGYFQIVRLHQNWRQEQAIVEEEHLPTLTLDNVHIKGLQRLLNTYDWQEKVSKADIVKICQCLETNGLR
ncbi:MAG: TetR/AcrR family transcriptional regulator [Psychromonas sp.]|nr:TetR/AcrR family transcriptional regulator [Alteromonadales bacterium]MCP5079349.1 TetR/AcrR family transcriptional regulator [Psychromonas sp.]